jgi:hypothetical protein
VVDAAGRPVGGATVFVREWATQRTIGMPSKESEKLFRGEEIPDILARGTTDADGRFRFEAVSAPAFPRKAGAGKTDFPWDVVVLAPGHGAAWGQLTPHNQRNALTLILPEEGTLRGRLVEPGGTPIAGARIKVSGIDRLGAVDVGGLGTEGRLNLLWSSIPLVATSDSDGRFTLGGLPRAMTASLIITDARHERKVVFAATTREPQPEVSQRTIQPGGAQNVTSTPVFPEEFTVTLKSTDHRLRGRVVFAATGKPAAGAWVSVGHLRAAETDANGKFQVENLSAGEIDLHIMAWKTDAAPLDLRLTLPEEPRTIERDFALPAGLVLTGRVVEEQTGAGVGAVELMYRPQYDAGQLPTIFGFQAQTEADGGFRLVVPPGRGSLEIWRLPSAYPRPSPRPIGSDIEPAFRQTVAGKTGETVQGLGFKVAHSQGIMLAVADRKGRPVAGAAVVRHGLGRQDEAPGRTDAAGRFELTGVDQKRGATVDVTHPTLPLGARADLLPDDETTKRTEAMEIILQPTGTLAGRVLEEEGKPLKDATVSLFTSVRHPDVIGTSVAHTDAIQNDGSFSFDRLIAGAEYYVEISAQGHASLFSERVKAKSGQGQRIRDVRLPVTDQELRGIVVDPRGQWVAGAMVSYQRDSDRQFVPPRSGRWFQETNAKGEFHLIELPRGRLKVMAYRRPQGADRNIENLVRVEVEPGQREVWIVLPDADERLRGIE